MVTWKGRWCEGHPLWNEYEPIAEQCGTKEKLELGDDGMPICGRRTARVLDGVVLPPSGLLMALLVREYEKDGSFMSSRTWLPGSQDSGTGGPLTDGDWPQNPQWRP